MKKGAIFSEKHKENLSLSHKGQKAWNKGKKGRQRNHDISGLRPHKAGEYHHSEKTLLKLSNSLKGRISPTKGTKLSDETREKLRKVARRGECSNFWKGGVSHNSYPEDWTDLLRGSIRERDFYSCQECGIHQDELSGRIKKLHVHHIDYNKENLDPNNLITLCISCHIKTNFNREEWIRYFNNK